MLVLKRAVGESIVLGGNGMPKVTVTVVKNKKGQLCLGIEAPPEVSIYREEALKVEPVEEIEKLAS